MSALKMAGIDDPDDDMATFVGSVNHNTRAGVRWGPGVLQMLSKKQRTIYGVRQEIDSMILNRIEAKASSGTRGPRECPSRSLRERSDSRPLSSRAGPPAVFCADSLGLPRQAHRPRGQAGRRGAGRP